MRKFESYFNEAAGAIAKSKVAQQSLKLFSVSEADMKFRTHAYATTLASTAMLEDMALRSGAKRRIMQFAAENVGMGAANLRGTTIYPATILSYVSSIAPIFGVERSMDTPAADLQFMDFYNLANSDLVLPNLGVDKPFGENLYQRSLKTQLDGTTTTFNIAVGEAIIPRTLRFKYTVSGTVYELVDNGNGKIFADPGLLSAGTVNYMTGDVAITFAAAPASTSDLTVECGLDIPAENSVDKVGGQNKYFHVTTEPVVIPLQRNIISDAAMNKQGVIDPNELYNNVITTLYTKAINEKVASAIVNNYDGNTYTADLSAFNLAAGRYDTFIRTFQSLLIDGETRLGSQTYKTAKVTGILAGSKISNVFQYMTDQEGWIPNNQLGYFKDLIGWYKGVPVVRWTNNDSSSVKVGDNDLYLTHRTPDGQLAPCVRGMFISPTDLPEIGNFANPTQITNGMFSLEGVRPTTSKLVVKLSITLPQSQVLQ